MNKLSKMLTLLLAVLLTLSLLLAGCGKSTGDVKKDATVSQNQQTTTQETSPKLDPVKLTWYYIGDDQTDASAVFAEANSEIQSKINATVDFKRFSFGDYDQKMKLKVSAGEQFDICYTADWMFNYNQNVAKGSFIELDKLIDQYAPKTKALIPDKIWNGTKINGKIYGVPNYQISFRQPGLTFKKELVDKYNLKDAIFNVKKMADLTPIFDTIKKNEPGIIPTSVAPSWIKFDVTTKDEYIDQIDFTVPVGLDANLNIIDMNNDPKIITNNEGDYKLSREWVQKGFYHKDVAVAKDLTPEMQAGKFFVLEDAYKPGGEADMEARFGYPVYTIPMGIRIISTGSITATLDAISRTSKNPERAMMLLELMNTDIPLYNLIVFGQEGKHYTKVSDNHIKAVDGAKYSGLAWMMGSQFNAYLLPGQADDVWDVTKKLNSTSTEAPSLGFAFDSSPVKTQIANIKSAQKLTENGKPSATTVYGLIDSNQYKAETAGIRDNVNKAGLKDFIAELQKQIDTWKSSK